jgi:hypothetical protein
MHDILRRPPLLPFFTPDGWFQVAEPEERDLRPLLGFSVERRRAHDVLSDWHLLAIHRLNRDATDVVVLGTSAMRAGFWLSPPIVVIDFERGSMGACTGRRYRLGARATGEPRGDKEAFLLRELGVEPMSEGAEVAR